MRVLECVGIYWNVLAYNARSDVCFVERRSKCFCKDVLLPLVRQQSISVAHMTSTIQVWPEGPRVIMDFG